MWRAAASHLLRRRAAHPPPSPATATGAACALRHVRLFSPPPHPPSSRPAEAEAEVTAAEARRLVRLVGVEALKRRLRDGREEVVGYGELLDACVEAGAARTRRDAEALARAMDEAGVVLLFRDKAYLHPEKVVELVRRAVPLALSPENDSRKEELKKLQEKKEEIDKLAHKHIKLLGITLGKQFITVPLSRITQEDFAWSKKLLRLKLPALFFFNDVPLSNTKYLEQPWDLGGFNSSAWGQAEFKERGLLDTLLGCTIAGPLRKSQLKQTQEEQYIKQ
ncbi:calcium uniporter protein 6, mitochondrial-like isoform X1 [Oryza glaberrima]|uniref:calcium uniporter protein 6, mitochondrial-like isoform X1 n=1 Tax=Oryza glaberrima TaxID=4538 RepID=UPI00224C362D|nr:calcium uniporter protein 6, mitochondrial-like isoform X1 [Oryza glaberrima]